MAECLEATKSRLIERWTLIRRRFFRQLGLPQNFLKQLRIPSPQLQ